ncbi:hypothetical protein MBEHAL_0339 [Halarchaeum acidiphilum MH1-52-1]|uniref:Uncharacterized protein n=1 Tax=Halarchaeum acidiphilum MH1-52-1 TaxID=1261545 RepID=U3A1Q2_9EURY|nr:hypothetical protein [Halarchaeum acidiphilum]GAD51579.1 hypothetical protein MBEHAL_0339 [Halarchaeum acidiphilum MH1-52-1]
MTSYYDHILGIIPVAFAAVAAALTLAGYTTAVAIPAAGGVAVVLVGHALFVGGPTDSAVETGQTGSMTAQTGATADERAPITAAE